ncbi:MAG: cyclic nucleotide-binding domain-containing protein [Azospirillum sp.]|nr:cyclic nucleotide-binding domain-containing protein [Azospirillum sp.]MCA3266292.1 cyclic nucleotide-binding domain-containing protein [Azospirillum sp.]
MDPLQILAFAAAAAAIASAGMRTTPPLRMAGMLAAVLVAAYGVVAGPAWLALAAGLALAAHAWRLLEARAMVERLANAEAPQPTALFALARQERCPADTVLFRKDETGDAMFLIVEGWVELVEIGKRLGPGQILGEVAMVVPSHKRSLTAKTVTPVTLARMTKRDMELTALQNPAFGFAMLRLVSRRLSDDVARLEAELARTKKD